MRMHWQNHICEKEQGMIGIAKSLVGRSSGCLKEAEARKVHAGARSCCVSQTMLKDWIFVKAIGNCQRVLSNVILCSLWLQYE